MENGEKVFCYICTKAYNEKKLSASSVESAYITNGYTNWKDAINIFNQHERSKCHADSVLKVVTVPRCMKDVRECLSSQHVKEKSESGSKCHLKAFKFQNFPRVIPPDPPRMSCYAAELPLATVHATLLIPYWPYHPSDASYGPE